MKTPIEKRWFELKENSNQEWRLLFTSSFLFPLFLICKARRLTSFNPNYTNKYLTNNENTQAISGTWIIDAAPIYHNPLIPAISTWSTLPLATIHKSPRIKAVRSLGIALSRVSTTPVFDMEWEPKNLSTHLHVFSGEEGGLPSVGTMELHAASAWGCIILRTRAIGCLTFAVLASKDAGFCQRWP